MSKFIAHPGCSRVFHIFDSDDGNRSLCGRYAMFRVDPKQCDPVTGDERWISGQDCKACWRKAGLLEEQ